MATIKITQRRSSSGHKPAQVRTLRALGLKGIGRSVVRPDTPDIRGMIFAIQHLVDVEEEGQ